MSIKKTFFAIILMISSMSAFSQLSTVVKIETADLAASQHEVQINVVWHLSDGSIKTNQVILSSVNDGDNIHVPFTGTAAEAAMVTDTEVTIHFADEAIQTSKSFSGFKYSVTCLHEEDEDMWPVLYLY